MDFGLLILGVVSGVAAGFFGIGGGVIIVPVLLLLGFDMQYAIGISVVQMIFSSVFGSILNISRKKLDIKIGALVGLGGLLGASLSGVIVANLDSQILLGAFILLTIFSVKKYIFNTKSQVNENPPIKNEFQKICALVGVGALTGIFAISLGIGGGLLISPLLAYLLGLDSKKIVPISLFFIIFAAISGSISMYAQGLLDLHKSFSIGAGAVVGVALGLFIIEKTSLKNHRYALICIYIFSLLVSIYKFALGF